MSARPPAADLAVVSDDQVMASVKAGSAAAFGVLYDRYCDRAYRVAWRLCAIGFRRRPPWAFISMGNPHDLRCPQEMLRRGC